MSVYEGVTDSGVLYNCEDESESDLSPEAEALLLELCGDE
jgi:hypothetical protein